MRTPDPTDELLRDWASRQEQDAKELRALTKRISEEARVSCFVSLPEVPAARRPSLSFLAMISPISSSHCTIISPSLVPNYSLLFSSFEISSRRWGRRHSS